MNFAKAFLSALILTIFISSANLAQTRYGRVQGTILDVTTGETLFGANVMLKGTSLGSATGVDGNYLITQIPPGPYTLIVRYIGYEAQEFDIQVEEGKTLQLNVRLSSQTIEGEEVVVTAQAQGQKGAINQQITSKTIKNIVSSERIHELPDDNAATALSRLPGLSIQQGDKVVIRGIQSKMNVILVNGVQLPSTDVNDRSTNLGFISSNMLSGIEVVKSITPDMDANAIGGVVNLRLREAPKEFRFDVMGQGSYNTQDRTSDNYKFWASASNRFLDNKLGVFLQGNIDRSNHGNDVAGAAYARMGVGGDRPYGEATYGMNSFTYRDELNIVQNYGASLILDYELPNGKLILQNTIAHTDNNLSAFRDQLDFVSTQRIYTLNRDKHNKELMINSLQGEYAFGDLKLNLGLSHSYSDKNTDLRYGDPGENYGFKNQSSTTPSFAAMPEAQRLKLTPEDIYKMYLNPDDWKVATIYAWAGTREEAFKQNLYTGNIDLTYPLSLSQDFSSELKIGGKINYSKRTNDLERTYCRITEPQQNKGAADFLRSIGANPDIVLQFKDFRNSDYKRGDYFLNGDYKMGNVINIDLMDQFMTLAPPLWVPGRHVSDSRRNDFDGNETFTAAYAMGEFNLGSRLSIITGVRFEHFNMDYKANFIFVTHEVDGVAKILDTLNTANKNDDRLFPNLQIRYKVTEWSDLRLAYTESISRPDFQAMLPNTYVGNANAGQAGNPLLRPTISRNLDAFLSFYNNEIGLFTIGGFYKRLTDIFYATTIYYQNLEFFNSAFPKAETFDALKLQKMSVGANIQTYVNNPHPAKIRGFELDWQTNFWYLPQPFNSLVLNINYTRVWSDMDYQQIRNIDSTYTYRDAQNRLRVGHAYLSRDTVRNARLLYQGDHILNVALGVDYKDFSARISFNLQGDVITSVGGRPEEDSFTGNVYKWDFTIQQKLPIKGLSIAFNGTNIFHSPIKNYQKFRRDVNGEVLENLTQTLYSPRRFEVNLRYSL
jgi:TonB-dependent receptor